MCIVRVIAGMVLVASFLQCLRKIIGVLGCQAYEDLEWIPASSSAHKFVQMCLMLNHWGCCGWFLWMKGSDEVTKSAEVTNQRLPLTRQGLWCSIQGSGVFRFSWSDHSNHHGPGTPATHATTGQSSESTGSRDVGWDSHGENNTGVGTISHQLGCMHSFRSLARRIPHPFVVCDLYGSYISGADAALWPFEARIRWMEKLSLAWSESGHPGGLG